MTFTQALPKIPFTISDQLCHDLTISRDESGTSVITSAEGRPAPCLPGQPFIQLDRNEVLPYVKAELTTPLLDRMAPHLWLVTTPRGSHVSALHEQIVRGRTIVITENPELHLIWIGGRIFIKPLPQFLLSHTFWEHFLQMPTDDENQTASDPNEEIRALSEAALGYVRTYFWLIRHESDFRIAKEAGLIPEEVRWPIFVEFIKGFGGLEDAQLSARYHFGEMRLSRLNFWAPILLRRWLFHKVAWQYGDYFARFYGPFLFIFAICSLILSAMQVGTAARPQWDRLLLVSAWFSALTLMGTALVLSWLLMLLIALVGREVLYAFRKKIRKAWHSRKTSKSGTTVEGISSKA